MAIGILLAIIVGEVIITTYIPDLRKDFYNALSVKDSGAFGAVLILFGALMGGLTLIQGFKTWLGQAISLIFRNQLTENLLAKWLSSSNLKLSNPCQRVNEDCKLCTELSMSVVIEGFISLGIVFILIYGARADTVVLTLSLIYTIIVLLVARFYKGYLINAEIAMQKAEADHRLSLSTITLGHDDGQASNKYEAVQLFYKKYIRTLLNYGLFNRGQTNFMPLVGYICLVGTFFAGQATLGDYMGRVAVFDLIVINSTILVQMYPTITKAQASWKRIRTFYGELE